MPTTYLIDLFGTLVGNADGLAEDEACELLHLLRERGDQVYVWSSLGNGEPLEEDVLPSNRLRTAIGPVNPKTPYQFRNIISSGNCIIIDDEEFFLRACQRLGGITISASSMRSLLGEVRLDAWKSKAVQDAAG